MIPASRRQFIARWLLIVFLAGVLSGCAGEKKPTTDAAGEQLLARGYYALYDTDEVLVGYLQVGKETLTRYGANGSIQRVHDLEYDAKEEVYLLDDGGSFTVRERGSGLRITTDKKERYDLKKVQASDIPDPAKATTPAPTTEVPPTNPPATEPPTVPPTTPAPTEPPTEPPTTPAPTEPPAPPVLSAEQIYELALPSTVNITAIIDESYYYQGTGFFYDENGTVITNYHVIDGCVSGYITLADGREYEIVKVLGYDELRDIAILSTEARGTVPLVRRTDPVHTGETVYALGGSLGLTGTFSNGIVSTASRVDDGLEYIQHTAAISHGNSGGPLLDTQGRVIGINCAFLKGGQNLNLAIPIADVDTIPRTADLSMRALCEQIYGPKQEQPVTDSWKGVYIAGKDDRYLIMDMPESMYETMELDDEGTGLNCTLTKDSYLIYLVTKCQYESISQEEYEAVVPQMTVMLDQLLAGYEMNFTPFEAQTVNIRDDEWLLLYSTASSEEMVLEVECLVYHDEKCVMLCVFVSALISSESTESDTAELNEYLRNMISSLRMKRE